MPENNPLQTDRVPAILAHLGVKTAVPCLFLLDQLVTAYTRHVPWETAFRIVKRAKTAVLTACPRWPDEFWQDNLTRGGGGTCFESNYAFYHLLRLMGFEGYLTVNNMGDSIGCHSAIIILLDGQKWLVDAGLPIYAPLPISPYGIMRRATPFMQFSARPDGSNRYQIERTNHPQPNAFTLIDQPVAEVNYRARTVADYGENGLFLDKVIINKVVDGALWRFNSSEKPICLTLFTAGGRVDHPLAGDVAAAITHQFGLETDVIAQALALTWTP